MSNSYRLLAKLAVLQKVERERVGSIGDQGKPQKKIGNAKFMSTDYYSHYGVRYLKGVKTQQYLSFLKQICD